MKDREELEARIAKTKLEILKPTFVKRLTTFFKQLLRGAMLATSILLGLFFTGISITIIFGFMFEGGFFN